MYRPIKRKIWMDPNFKDLDVYDRYLFIYLLTNNHSHISGLYHIPRYIIRHETSLTEKRITHALDVELSEFCSYDKNTETVWVKNMLKHQIRNKSIYISILKQIRSLHPSPVIKGFWGRYGKEIHEITGDELPDEYKKMGR